MFGQRVGRTFFKDDCSTKLAFMVRAAPQEECHVRLIVGHVSRPNLLQKFMTNSIGPFCIHILVIYIDIEVHVGTGIPRKNKAGSFDTLYSTNHFARDNFLFHILIKIVVCQFKFLGACQQIHSSQSFLSQTPKQILPKHHDKIQRNFPLQPPPSQAQV